MAAVLQPVISALSLMVCPSLRWCCTLARKPPGGFLWFFTVTIRNSHYRNKEPKRTV